MRNAEYAPTGTPKSVRLIKCLKSYRFYRSSGARHAWSYASPSVSQSSPRAKSNRAMAPLVSMRTLLCALEELIHRFNGMTREDHSGPASH